MMPVGLPTPNYDVEYSDTEMETVKSVTVTTFSTSYIMVNSGYDPETKTLNSFEKWRGLGDASTEGEWSYDVTSKSFNLKKYLVDASYNGELDPEVVFSSKQK
jgi:hypothetical protein